MQPAQLALTLQALGMSMGIPPTVGPPVRSQNPSGRNLPALC